MSYAGARAQVAAQLANVTWTVPASAIEVPIIKAKTAFGPQSIFTAEWVEELKSDRFPVARVWIPTIDEARKTSGTDTASQKLQLIAAQVFVYLVVEKRYSQAGEDYFDAMLDATMAYFRQHSGGGGTPSLGNNDLMVGSALRQRAVKDLAELDGNYYKYRATLSPTLQMSIV